MVSVAHLRRPRTAGPWASLESIALERAIAPSCVRRKAPVSERQSSTAEVSACRRRRRSEFREPVQAWPEGAAGWIRADPFDRRLPLPLTLSYTRKFKIPIAICDRVCNFFLRRRVGPARRRRALAHHSGSRAARQSSGRKTNALNRSPQRGTENMNRIRAVSDLSLCVLSLCSPRPPLLDASAFLIRNRGRGVLSSSLAHHS